MVVEHTFITTLEATDAMRHAIEFLTARGFEVIEHNAFPIDSNALDSIELRRGRKNAARAKSVSQLPQTLRIEFDRGRITVALSIAANHVWGGGGFMISSSSGQIGNVKKMRLHQQLLTSIAVSLERLLTHHDAPAQAAVAWDEAERANQDAARRRTRRNLIILGIVVTLLTVVVTLIVFAATV